MWDRWLRGKASQDLLIYFDAQSLTITSLQIGEQLRIPARIGVHTDRKGKPSITGIGDDIVMHEANTKVHQPFDHPRLCIADFQLAEKLLQRAIVEFHQNKWINPSPRVVLQPLHNLEGGLTFVERKMLTELALGASAREVVIVEVKKPISATDSYTVLKQRFDGE